MPLFYVQLRKKKLFVSSTRIPCFLIPSIIKGISTSEIWTCKKMHEQDGEMHDRCRVETHCSEGRKYPNAKSDFSRKSDNPNFYVQVPTLETLAINSCFQCSCTGQMKPDYSPICLGALPASSQVGWKAESYRHQFCYSTYPHLSSQSPWLLKAQNFHRLP